MILLNFRAPGRLKLGVKTPLGIVDVSTAVTALGQHWPQGWVPDRMQDLLVGGTTVIEAMDVLVERVLDAGPNRSYLTDEREIDFGPCIPRAGKIICLGYNYASHVAERGVQTPTVPVLFSKLDNTLAATGDEIPLPPTAEQYDYEAELGVVIGRRTRSVSEADALNYVFGYCNANDVSARDLQFRTSQFLLGKSLDKFFPVGPYLVTADEVADPQHLSVRCWLNGELRQDGNTSDMIFSVAHVVSYISQYMTLEPGDIISTGTPSGVIHGMKDPRWLRLGDEVTVEIEGLGQLTNRFRAQ